MGQVIYDHAGTEKLIGYNAEQQWDIQTEKEISCVFG